MKQPHPAAFPQRLGKAFLICLSLWLATSVAHAQPLGIHVPAQATPILPVDQVRIGMKGYGLTVLHGVTIEPFNVEVISIMNDTPDEGMGPRQPIIWIRCPDARMEQAGAVHGMSGSPIYLWGPDEPHVLGKGGKLIGAYAFGYEEMLECYVGVQPIETMLAVNDHLNDAMAKTSLDGGAGQGDEGDRQPVAASSLRTLLASPAIAKLSPSQTWRARALQRLEDSPENPLSRTDSAHPPDFATIPPTLPAPEGSTGHVQHMMLPMCVGSPQISCPDGAAARTHGLAAHGRPDSRHRLRPAAGDRPQFHLP